MQVKAYNDGGWFTLFRSFGEKNDGNLPQFFYTLANVRTYIYIYNKHRCKTSQINKTSIFVFTISVSEEMNFMRPAWLAAIFLKYFCITGVLRCTLSRP